MSSRAPFPKNEGLHSDSSATKLHDTRVRATTIIVAYPFYPSREVGAERASALASRLPREWKRRHRPQRVRGTGKI